MDELAKEIRELRERTARTRYAFLRAEFETCSTALEMAKYELSVGNVATAGREVACVDAGLLTIRRFLSQIPADQKLETKLAELQAVLELLRAQVA